MKLFKAALIAIVSLATSGCGGDRGDRLSKSAVGSSSGVGENVDQTGQGVPAEQGQPVSAEHKLLSEQLPSKQLPVDKLPSSMVAGRSIRKRQNDFAVRSADLVPVEDDYSKLTEDQLKIVYDKNFKDSEITFEEWMQAIKWEAQMRNPQIPPKQNDVNSDEPDADAPRKTLLDRTTDNGLQPDTGTDNPQPDTTTKGNDPDRESNDSQDLPDPQLDATKNGIEDFNRISVPPLIDGSSSSLSGSVGRVAQGDSNVCAKVDLSKKEKLNMSLLKRGTAEYNGEIRAAQPTTDYKDHSYLRGLYVVGEFEKIQTSSMTAWEKLGGPLMIAGIRGHIEKKDTSSAYHYEQTVRLWYLASELLWMKPKQGQDPFKLNEADKNLICSELNNASIVDEMRKTTTSRIGDRQQRNDIDIEYGSKSFVTGLNERHPLAKLPTLCSDISEFDVALTVLNHRLGRHIKEKMRIGGIFEVEYVRNSIISDINQTLEDIASSHVLKWFKGARGNIGQVRDWYGNIGAALFNPKYGYFVEDSDKTRRLNPSVADFTNPSVSKETMRLRYRGIGRYLAILLIEGMAVNVVFNYGFYLVLLKLMNVESLTKQDLLLDDPVYYNSWKIYDECLELNNCDETAFSPYPPDMVSADGKREFVSDGLNVEVTEKNVKEYAQHLLKDHMFNRFEPLYAEIVDGFYEMLPENVLDFVTVDHLMQIYRGNVNLSAKELNKSIRWPSTGTYAAGKEGYIWLNEIFETSQEIRNKFIKFATSLVVPPNGGFVAGGGGSGPGLISINDNGSAYSYVTTRGNKKVKQIAMPKSFTCGYSVNMPVYDTKEELFDKFNEAINNLSFSYNNEPDPAELELLKSIGDAQIPSSQ